MTSHRGQADFPSRRGFVTLHPSYRLRLPSEAARSDAYARFVADLRQAQRLAG